MPQTVVAVEVYESQLSEKSVCVLLNAAEVDEARNSNELANSLGAKVAYEMIRLAGIPESITGKVASLPVWTVLCNKYSRDIARYSKGTASNSTLMLKYRVDLDGVRAIWEVSGYADDLMPGSKSTKAVVDIVNRLINASLR